MQKYSVLFLPAILFFYTLHADAGDEKNVFKSLRCQICHKADTGKSYPSLKKIATVYNGDQEKLISYMKGYSDHIVNKEKSKTMERYIEKTKALSEDDLKSLADFILSHKD